MYIDFSHNYAVRGDMCIEREMVAHSHNLVQVSQVAEMTNEELGQMVELTIQQVHHLVSYCAKKKLPYGVRLKCLKNAAYAWRHFITSISALEKNDYRVPDLLSFSQEDPSMKILLTGLKNEMKSDGTWEITYGWSRWENFYEWTYDKHWIINENEAQNRKTPGHQFNAASQGGIDFVD